MSEDSGSGLSRRQMIAAGTGLIAATAAGPPRAAARGRQGAADGTPEQIHLTWGDDPTRTVVVSWASPGQAERPRVRIGQRVIAAAERACTGAPSGAVTWTYHARVDGLRPGATYGYAVTADNDANAADPFSATFTTAPAGRAAFRFTSFGDLAAPQAAYAVGAVETFQPLFHLLNGDLADADLTPGAPGQAPRAQAWRDFGNNVQASAANRPWLPVPGDHELPNTDDEHGIASYLTRYTLPSNAVEGLEGRWYAFRVGTALFVCLSGDDVAYSATGTPAAGAPAGPAPLPPELPAGNTLVAEGHPPVTAGTSAGRGYSGGAQTRWLESTLATARADASIDWIVVQLHQCACSSAPAGNGSDLGVRREWLPLFDTYEVDLVLSGHDRGYERSFPVRGFDAAAGTDTLTGAVTDTRRPRPVTTVDSGVFDTSQGTVHLVLGSGGSARGPAGSGATQGEPGPLPRVAKVLTRPAQPGPDQRAPGDEPRAAADAVEAATWSARRDASTGYGIAVFDVSPGSEAGGQTSVTVRYYHAGGPDAGGPDAGDAGLAGAGAPGAPGDDYTLFETFTLVRPRSDGRRWHPKGWLVRGWMS
ncbi:MAG: purple acid phosphatase family protein [Trebonia sp.]